MQNHMTRKRVLVAQAAHQLLKALTEHGISSNEMHQAEVLLTQLDSTDPNVLNSLGRQLQLALVELIMATSIQLPVIEDTVQMLSQLVEDTVKMLSQLEEAEQTGKCFDFGQRWTKPDGSWYQIVGFEGTLLVLKTDTGETRRALEAHFQEWVVVYPLTLSWPDSANAREPVGVGAEIAPLHTPERPWRP